MSNPLEGRLVRLSVANTDEVIQAWQRWNADTEFKRLLDDQAPRMVSPAEQRKSLDGETHSDKDFFFAVRPMNFDAKIGFTALWVNWLHRDAFVAIGIGDRMYWGKGYGTDAMRLTLRYAFEELNLHRVSLTVWAVNERAIRSYINAGFRVEGRVREHMQREGRRLDMLVMGVLGVEFRGMHDA
jgi:RimJ/RimL family protein N-acetyltransferase